MRLLSFAAALVLSVLASCSQSASEPKTKHSGSLHLAISAAPKSFSPVYSDSPSAHMTAGLLFEGLTRLGPDGTPELGMADQVDISENYKTYIFHLREAKWSDGEPVTAYDFAAAWRKIIDPEQNTVHAPELMVLRNATLIRNKRLSPEELGVYASDAETLVVALEHPVRYFLELTASPVMLPIPAHVDSSNPVWHVAAPPFVCNGPYTLGKASSAQKIVLSKNPNYWNADQVAFEQIDLAVVPSPDAQVAMYEEGQLDWIGGGLSVLPYSQLKNSKLSDDLKTSHDSLSHLIVANTQHPIVGNQAFRKALSLALDRHALANEADTVHKVAQRFVPFSMDKYAPYNYLTDNNAERAAHLLDKALQELRIENGELTPLRLAVPAESLFLKLATAIKQQWETVLGIRVQIEPVTSAVHEQLLQDGEFEVATVEYSSLLSDPIVLLEIFEHASDIRNSSRWEKVEYGEILAKARQTIDPEKRRQLLRNAEAMLMDAMPVIPVFHSAQAYLSKPSLQHVSLKAGGTPNFRWARFE